MAVVVAMTSTEDMRSPVDNPVPFGAARRVADSIRRYPANNFFQSRATFAAVLIMYDQFLLLLYDFFSL